MASISSLYNCNFYFKSGHPNPNPNHNFLSGSASLGFKNCRRNQHILCCSNNSSLAGKQHSRQQSSCWNQEIPGRREALFNIAFSGFIFPAIVPNVLAEDFRVYTDDTNKFQISIPQDWQVGTGEPSGFKSVTAFYPNEAANLSVSVVITGLGPDFTRMESFGKVEEFAETLVSGLDRSWQRPPGVTAKLIGSKSSKGIYYIEYTLQNPGETRKHLLSALGMASNGWYNRLYTVTGQYVDEESEKFGPKVQKVVSSFKLVSQNE